MSGLDVLLDRLLWVIEVIPLAGLEGVRPFGDVVYEALLVVVTIPLAILVALTGLDTVPTPCSSTVSRSGSEVDQTGGAHVGSAAYGVPSWSSTSRSNCTVSPSSSTTVSGVNRSSVGCRSGSVEKSEQPLTPTSSAATSVRGCVVFMALWVLCDGGSRPRSRLPASAGPGPVPPTPSTRRARYRIPTHGTRSPGEPAPPIRSAATRSGPVSPPASPATARTSPLPAR